VENHNKTVARVNSFCVFFSGDVVILEEDEIDVMLVTRNFVILILFDISGLNLIQTTRDNHLNWCSIIIAYIKHREINMLFPGNCFQLFLSGYESTS
jgi:hypothetical protein